MLLKSCAITVFILAATSMLMAQQALSVGNSVLTVGDPKAAYRIEVFYDMQCGACASFHPKLMRVIDRYPEKVFVIFRHFPLQMHNHAFTASSVVEAARRQGKGLEMVGMLLLEQSAWSAVERPFPIIFRYVDKLGLDKERFRRDVMSDEVARTVLLDMNRAKALGVNSLPAAILNGRQLSFPELSDLEEIISKGN